MSNICRPLPWAFFKYKPDKTGESSHKVICMQHSSFKQCIHIAYFCGIPFYHVRMKASEIYDKP